MIPDLDAARKAIGNFVKDFMDYADLEPIDASELQIRLEALMIAALREQRQQAFEDLRRLIEARRSLWKSHGGTTLASPYSHLTLDGEFGVILDELQRHQAREEG